jgi:DNA-directed RNA polymerase specialized sigma24 family protein
MQPPTDTRCPEPRGDEDELYRRHHRELHRAVSRAVHAPSELIEDACQTAWVILLHRQPERAAIFAWLRVVAIHEAYRLSTLSRREARLESLRSSELDWTDLITDSRSVGDVAEALEALRALASLPDRQREDLALKIAGYSYAEIRRRTPGRTATNVNKSLVKARRNIRQARARSGAAG